MKPLFSVVMAVYNTEKYVSAAIDSVLNQTFSDFELIIIDDGSTDRSPAIVDAYAAKDSRVVVVHQENRWIFPTYNRAIQMARGAYITFCNSDDVLVPDALEIMAVYIQTYGVDVVFENVSSNLCDENQNIILEGFQRSAMKEPFVVLGKDNIRKNWTSFMRLGLVRNCANTYKTSLMRAHPFREDIYGADFFLNIELASEICSVACYPKDLYIQYVYQGSDTLNASVGKYYPYEHDMFNEFYVRYMELFESWDLLDETAVQVLCGMRAVQLQTELGNVISDNCPLSPEERCASLLGCMDDIVFRCCVKANVINRTEDAILKECIKIAKSGALDRNSPVYRALRYFWTPAGGQEQELLSAWKTFCELPENPSHLGLAHYEAAARKTLSRKDQEYVEYLWLKRNARYAYLDNDAGQILKYLPGLEQANYSDPEKYSLLCGGCLLVGDPGKALAWARDGLALFPDDADLQENYSCLAQL